MIALKNITLLLTNPVTAFENVRERKSRALVPLLLVFLSSALLWLYYYQQVDLAWLQQALLDQASVAPEDEAAYRQLMQPMPMLVSALLGSWVGHIAMIGLFSAYLKLICKVDTENPYGYFAWCAFSILVFMPAVVADGISYLYLLLSNQPMLPQAINITTVNGLFLELPPSHPWYSYFEMFSLMGFWYVALATVGLTVWTRFDRSHALVIAGLPFVLLFFVWGIVNFLILVNT